LSSGLGHISQPGAVISTSREKKATVYETGKETVVKVLKTAGGPAAIRLTADSGVYLHSAEWKDNYSKRA